MTDFGLVDYQNLVISDLARDLVDELSVDEEQREMYQTRLKEAQPQLVEYIHQQLPFVHVFGIQEDSTTFIRDSVKAVLGV